MTQKKNTRIRPITTFVGVIGFLFTRQGHVNAFSSGPRTSIMTQGIISVRRTTNLNAISKRQIGVLDGAELASLKAYLYRKDGSKDIGMDDERTTPRFTSASAYAAASRRGLALVPFVIGTVEGDERRIIGIQCADKNIDDDVEKIDMGDNVFADSESVAYIPNGVSDDDAISTAMASLVGVHCCVSRLEEVGGSHDDTDEENFVSGAAVVVGGNDYACFASRALASLGMDVTLVSTSTPKLSSSNVQIIGPSNGEMEIGFSDFVGQFESVLDTIFDESDTTSADSTRVKGSGIVEELKRKHNCANYVSTYSTAQKIIRDEGVFFGPGKTKEYQKKISTSSFSLSSLERDFQVPKGFGPDTLQTLLNQKILFPSKEFSTLKSSNGVPVITRGWNLKDFWEYTSWPRDVGGDGNSRFGLPVADELDSEESLFLLEKLRAEQGLGQQTRQEQISVAEEEREVNKNPYVLDIIGIDGLQQNVISPQRDCVLFLSAPYCRTCKTLNPQFTRMARNDSSLLFAKADATGEKGKALGRKLGIRAVPAFVMFRNGSRYGSPLSISRLPDKKMNLAVDYLKSDKGWDNSIFSEE